MNNHRERTCVLIVEDDPGYVWTIQIALEAKGYEVLVTSDGQTAIECAATGEPDLIVLGIEMPDLDGYEVCRCIRAFSTVPIIMLTISTGTAHMVKGLRMGADQCMVKPFVTKELVARMQALLRRVEISQRKGYRPAF